VAPGVPFPNTHDPETVSRRTDEWSAAAVQRRHATASESARPTCWICGSPDVIRWSTGTVELSSITPDDFRITDAAYGSSWPMERCRHCDFVFASISRSVDLLDLYGQMSDPEYARSQVSRVLQMRWLLTAARNEHPGARTLLDVGAATGLLVAEARRMGLDAVGIEPSEALVSVGRSSNGVDLLHGVLPHPALTERRFDIVCMVDVIEHVTDPLQLLMDARALLAPDGILIVVTPDIQSLTARALGSRWWHHRLAHVCFFDRQSMEQACSRAALSVRREFRARWFFQIEYLAVRMEQYLPVVWLNRMARRVRVLSWFYRRIIPLNLHDSLVFLLHSRA
jgi:2-polyprenyl-3-methyl-5-hydroxy-6-metoxy-1,4-benzoquinol methylase